MLTLISSDLYTQGPSCLIYTSEASSFPLFNIGLKAVPFIQFLLKRRYFMEQTPEKLLPLTLLTCLRATVIYLR